MIPEPPGQQPEKTTQAVYVNLDVSAATTQSSALRVAVAASIEERHGKADIARLFEEIRRQHQIQILQTYFCSKLERPRIMGAIRPGVIG